MSKIKKVFIGLICAVMFTAGTLLVSPQKNMNNSQAVGPITHWGTEFDNDTTAGDTPENPYRIGTATTLNNSTVRTKMGTANKYFVLVTDIDLAAFPNWTPIPALGSGSVFDGNGFTIKNLKITSGSNTGLFNGMAGTIKDLTMTDVNISTSGSVVAAVAAVPNGSVAVPSRFQNVVVKNGTINCTSISSEKIGAICAAPSSGKTIIEDCYNGADISGGFFIGGIAGYSASFTNIEVRRSGNEGAINSSGTTFGYAGGIMGLVEGGTVSIEHCYNRGTITAEKRDCGGILGCGWSGTYTIKNCFNDSKLNIDDITDGNKGAIVSYHGTNLTLTNCWYNTDTLAQSSPVWTTHPSQGDNANAAATAATTGVTASYMNSQAFLNAINPPSPTAPIFVMIDGKPRLASMIQKYSYSFFAGEGQGPSFVMYQPVDDTIGSVLRPIQLPTEGTQGFTIPTKSGYIFSGWTDVTNVGTYSAGAQYTNPGTTNVTFTARYEKARFNLDFSHGGMEAYYRNSLGVLSTSAEIVVGDTGSLHIPDSLWTAGLQWQVLVPNSQSWAPIGDTQTIPLNTLIPDNETGYAFISSYAEKYAGALANPAGKIGIKVVDQSNFRNVLVSTNLQGSGIFELTTSTGGAVTIPLGSEDKATRISLPNTGFISSMKASASQHYKFSNIEIFNGSNRLYVTTQANVVNSGTQSELNLGNLDNFTNGYEIRVNFEKIKYNFSLSAGYLRNGSYTQLPGLFSLNPDEPNTLIQIDEMVSVNADAAYESDGSTYRFVAWKILDFSEDRNGIYMPIDYGNNALSVSALANFDWLERYLNGNGFVIIVAEFAETYKLSVNIFQGQESFGSVNIFIYENGMPLTYTSGMRVAKNSLVTIDAKANTMYKFDKFQGRESADSIDNSSTNKIALTFTISTDREITVCFTYENYEFSFYAEDKDKNPIPDVGGYRVEINNAASQTIKIGDSITRLGFTKKEGYRFEKFIILKGDGTAFEITDVNGFPSFFVSANILSKNLNAAKKFEIIAVYIKLIVLDISVYESCVGMGTFDVYYLADFIAGRSPTQDREFDANEKILVIATAGNFYKFNASGFSGNNTSELDSENPHRLNLTMDSLRGKRTIHIKFTSMLINIYDSGLSTQGSGEINVNKTDNYVVGEWVTIVASPGLYQQVRNWTLFGNKLTTYNSSDYVRSGNILSVRLSEDMLALLARNDYVLISDVEFSLSDNVLMLIIIPSSVVFLLAVLLIINLISLNKKKKVIRAQLLYADKVKKTMGIGSLISDLREGKNVGQVTEADVNAELKRRRDERK